MPKKPKADGAEETAKPPKTARAEKSEKPEKHDKAEKTGLVAAAEAVGSAAGKVAALVGAATGALHTPSRKKGKLQPKHKHRLPRRQKKAQQKLKSGQPPKANLAM